ncbi:MAG: sugar phosphate isomerase/epimerase family protein, partial [Thermomicrobiales bacterium]
DLSREMPLATGIIDLAGFMRAIAALGYDGPVIAEPFSAPVTDLAATDPLAAARLLADATARSIALAEG